MKIFQSDLTNNAMSPLLTFLTVVFLGLPVVFLSLKYFKLRYNYFKLKYKNDFDLLKKVFNPVSLNKDIDNEAVKQINKLTPILWLAFLGYGLTMVILGSYVQL